MKTHVMMAGAALALTLGTSTVSGAFAQAGSNDDSMRGPARSDSNLRVVRNNLDRLIDQLQNDNRDYGGYRVTAIKDLQTARQDLATALGKDASNSEDNAMQQGPNSPTDPNADDASRRGPAGSDRNIAHVADRVSALIDQLQSDRHDYHGYRIAAIKDLQKARTDLQSAASHDTAH